ncbi:LacI family DNA-binding transcriptional regulator [Bosea sp. PAMC 26642]|uniref:LacI family DNA-binding transcriptional regulator n=1 Tax=Bosea sp. (strain PAMC 26642) TaxID=1792307 RepID=UPI00143ADF2B|nr:LacI family DNA-binding transcriptional regulator [Bosea sp. PAMC 26642]
MTIVDVARELGIAPSTVSNALHDKSIVAPSTKARIIAKAREMNYEASAAARALVTRHSMTIGVLLPDFANPVYSEIIKGLDRVMARRGYATLIASTENDEAKRLAATDAFIRRQVDGLVVISQSLLSAELQRFSDAGLPAVFVHRKPIDHPDGAGSVAFDYVGMDNVGGLDAAVAHLARLGHRRIGLIGGPQRSSAAKERTIGFLGAVRRLGLDGAPNLIVDGNYEFVDGLDCARRLLALRKRPTAIVAANDLMAFAAMDVAQQMGLTVPNDLSVVGVDDIFVAVFPMISLTTVKQPAREIGESAGLRLLERFDADNLPPKIVTLPADLVVRHSTSDAPMSVRRGATLSAEALESYLAARWKPTTIPVT